MAREVRTFEATIPAGTAEAAPVTVNLPMPARVVRSVRVRMPSGFRGQVGWALGAAGQRVIPWGGSGWIVGDDEVIDWTLEDAITSGAWQLQGYNVGAFDHTVYVTFSLDTVGSPDTTLSLGPLPL